MSVFLCCEIVVSKFMRTNLFGAVLTNDWLIVAVMIGNICTYKCKYVKLLPYGEKQWWWLSLWESCGAGCSPVWKTYARIIVCMYVRTYVNSLSTGKTVVLGCRVCSNSYNGICNIYSLSNPRYRHKNTLCKQVEVEVGRRGFNMRLAKNLGRIVIWCAAEWCLET